MVQVSCTLASREYVICTLSAVLCIPKGEALRVQITYTREYIKLHSGYKSHTL